jgi:hypothetical protein
MARKGALRGKFGGKLERKNALAERAFVPIPGDKARRYVNFSTGEIVSRRQAEKLVIGQPENLAKVNASRRALEAGPTKASKYWDAVRAYKARNPGMTTRQAQKDESFVKLWDALRVDLRNTSARKSRVKTTTKARLRALRDFDMISEEEYLEYLSHYHTD